MRRCRAARGDDADAANGADAGPLATLGLTPDQIDAIVRALTDEERARPGVLRPPEHRRVAARANALLVSASSQSSEASALSVTASDVGVAHAGLYDSVGVPADEATPLQNVFGFFFTAFSFWYFARAVRKRSGKAREFRVANRLPEEERKKMERAAKLGAGAV